MSIVQGGAGPWVNNPGYTGGVNNTQTGGVQNQQAPVLSPHDYKASNGIMSGSDLIAQMGGAPKADVVIFGKTIKTNSDAYKGALESLDTYQHNLDAVKGRDVSTVPKTVIDGLKTSLQEVIDKADAYEAKHAGSDKKADRRGVMAELKAMAQAEMGRLDDLGTLTNTGGKHIDVPTGLTLLRGGVTDCSQFTPTLNDQIIDPTRSKGDFGSGKVNSVALVAYGTDMRVVKGVAKEAKALMNGETTTGFDQKDMRTAARNVASANVAEELGIGASLPQCEIILSGGNTAIAMKVAPGESLIHKDKVEVTNQQDIQKYDNELAKGWLDNLKNYKVSKDPTDGKWYKEEVGFKDIPYSSQSNPSLAASVQQGLLDLQTLDCLMGQMDRQPENIYIRVQGNVAQITGIDNDMCMGPLLTGLDSLKGGTPLGDIKKTYGGPPPLMSRSMYTELTALAADEDNFKQLLGPEFTQDEVDAAVSRLRLLKTHADQLNTTGCIVDNFETWRGVDPKTNQSVNAFDFMMNSDYRSYVKRDATTLGKTNAPVALDVTKH